MYCSEFYKGGFMKKLILPRELLLGDIIYLTLADTIWLRQGDKDTHCLDHYYEEDFSDFARFVAQTHKFGIKEIETPGAEEAYQFVQMEEEEDETKAKAEAEATLV